MLKVIATGKGGVGKTTTISTLATMFSREGTKVLVFDTDPSMNLAMTLGQASSTTSVPRRISTSAHPSAS